MTDKIVLQPPPRACPACKTPLAKCFPQCPACAEPLTPGALKARAEAAVVADLGLGPRWPA